MPVYTEETPWAKVFKRYTIVHKQATVIKPDRERERESDIGNGGKDYLPL